MNHYHFGSMSWRNLIANQPLRQPEEKREETKWTKLTVEEFHNYCNDGCYEIDIVRKHVDLVPNIPDAPEGIDVNMMTKEFQTIEQKSEVWAKVEEKVKKHPRFYHSPLRGAGVYCFLQAELEKFVGAVKKAESVKGDKNSEKFVKMSKHFLAYLSKLNDEKKLDCLVDMALNNADQDGYYPYISRIYHEKVESAVVGSLNLEQRVYRKLDYYRNELFSKGASSKGAGRDFGVLSLKEFPARSYFMDPVSGSLLWQDYTIENIIKVLEPFKKAVLDEFGSAENVWYFFLMKMGILEFREIKANGKAT